jgi:hypothetical protein
MSIREMMREWINAGEMVVLEPALASIPTVRFVFATKEVAAEIYGPWEDKECEIRYARARAVIDAFIGGARIATRHPPSRSAKAQLALLDPPQDQVWEFRSREPKPGVRVFGRFFEASAFVALGTELRENIDDNFTKEKERCKREWRKFFTPYPPHQGSSLSDYLTDFYAV